LSLGQETEGDMNVVAIGWTGDGVDVTSVSDSEGNAYSVAAATAQGGGLNGAHLLNQAIYVSAGVQAKNADLLTVTMSGQSPIVVVRAYELAGVGSVDMVAGANSCPAVLQLPAERDELVFAACMGCIQEPGFTVSSTAAGTFPTATSSAPRPPGFYDGLGYDRSPAQLSMNTPPCVLQVLLLGE
jgi:hypothetical protein